MNTLSTDQSSSKCDLASPSCGQCLRAGISCLGYRDDASMRFRIVNNESFQQRTRHHRRKIRYNNPPIAKADSTKNSQNVCAQILYEPSQVWNDHVIPLVLERFSIELVGTIKDSSMFATIPRIVSTSQKGSPVYAVCDAIACAYLSSTTGTTAAMVNRSRAYGAALRTVNTALDDPVQCRNDSTLLAVWMFVVYEVGAVHRWKIKGQES